LPVPAAPRHPPSDALIPCKTELSTLPDWFLKADFNDQAALLLNNKALDKYYLDECEAKRKALDQFLTGDVPSP
jgi:hypothetical protein